MLICIISDTHTKHKRLGKLPEADVIIHCGDATSIGREHEVRNFFEWFSKLEQYKYKIFVAGNHDWLFETNRTLALSYKPENIIYLEDSEVIIDDIKFYGSPVTKPFGNWAFNRPEDKLLQHWKAIPNDVDVLITHGPPNSVLDVVKRNDTHQGSPTLYNEIVRRIRPKIHCFGHIHEGYGSKIIDNIRFINASVLDETYDCVNEPVLIEI